MCITMSMASLGQNKAKAANVNINIYANTRQLRQHDCRLSNIEYQVPLKTTTYKRWIWLQINTFLPSESLNR